MAADSPPVNVFALFSVETQGFGEFSGREECLPVHVKKHIPLKINFVINCFDYFYPQFWEGHDRWYHNECIGGFIII